MLQAEADRKVALQGVKLMAINVYVHTITNTTGCNLRF